MRRKPTPRSQNSTGEEVEEVVVTGFRRSLTESTDAKRNSVGFIDSIFAEDIGKFPDTNLAESFNRIPGITITREITGEGLNVAIRGLNTNFTRVLLNNAPVAVASTGRTNAQNTNREVDLDMFPTELFSQLTVHKTPSDEHTVEGGAAGTINMRMARPFDNEGGTSDVLGSGHRQRPMLMTPASRGSMVASDTWDTFGVLVGCRRLQQQSGDDGIRNHWLDERQPERRSMRRSHRGQQHRRRQLDQRSGNRARQCEHDRAGLTPGATIDRAFLLANNPGLTIQQIDNALIPRLGRPMFEDGDKDRYNAVISLEFRPRDDLHFFLDSMYGKKENDLERVDMNLGRAPTARAAIVPLNMQVDRDELRHRLRRHQRHVRQCRSIIPRIPALHRRHRVLGYQPRHELADHRQVEPRRAGQLHQERVLSRGTRRCW